MRCVSSILLACALLAYPAAVAADPPSHAEEPPCLPRTALTPLGQGGDQSGPLRAFIQLPNGDCFEFSDAGGPIVQGGLGPGVGWYQWVNGQFQVAGVRHGHPTFLIGGDDLAWWNGELWGIHGSLPVPAEDPQGHPAFASFLFRSWEQGNDYAGMDRDRVRRAALSTADDAWLATEQLACAEIAGLAIDPAGTILIGFGQSTATATSAPAPAIGIARFDPVTPALTTLAWIAPATDSAGTSWELRSMEYAPDGNTLWLLLASDSRGRLLRIDHPGALVARSTPLTSLGKLGTAVLDFEGRPSALGFVDKGQGLLIGFPGRVQPPRSQPAGPGPPLPPSLSGAAPQPPRPWRQWEYVVLRTADLNDPAALRAMCTDGGIAADLDLTPGSG